MRLKDYYKILELEPSATLPEIKQAYRRLAQLYHPDKNSDPYSVALFGEIKEAYEVLTNRGKKEFYLQQRWYNQSIGKKKMQSVVTPVSVLKEALDLERYVSRLDHHRLDKQGLFEYILEELDDQTIEKLKGFNEQEIVDQIINTFLKTIKVLKANQAARVGQQLLRLSGNASKKKIDDAVRQLQKKQSWESKEPFLVLLVTILICLLIWLSIK